MGVESDIIQNNDVGDWFETYYAHHVITVHHKLKHKEQLLVAVHELIESILCKDRGITDEVVSEWDRLGGNGDQKKAPYYKEHKFATKLEKMLAKELNVDWDKYEKHIDKIIG